MKVLGALLLLLLAIASCKSPTSTVVATPVEIYLTPTPTPKPYWDLQPLPSQPEGGWKTYRSDELNFAFQYPAVYDEDDCGKIWVKEGRVFENEAYTAIGLNSGINVHVFEAWTGDVAERAAMIKSAPEYQALTELEQFTIGGMPALRLIYSVPAQSNIDYIKVAWTAFAGRLYLFHYSYMPSTITACDAPPLSDEAVYEHLLATVEFNR